MQTFALDSLPVDARVRVCIEAACQLPGPPSVNSQRQCSAGCSLTGQLKSAHPQGSVVIKELMHDSG